VLVSSDEGNLPQRNKRTIANIFAAFFTRDPCFWRLVHCWYTVGTVLVDLWRLVPYTNDFECFWRLVQCTIRQKQSKDSQKSKNHHWCNNRHMSSQSPPNTQSRANAATSRDLHHMCLGSGHSPSSVGRADSMRLHGRPCVWLPFAAACCYTLFYLLMMPAARLVCQWPSSNFPYFRTPLANFLLSRPNSVEYFNSKTLILKQLHCCPRLNVRVHSSKVELAAAGVHPVGTISLHASV